MSHRVKIKTQRQKRRLAPVILFALLLVWSLASGWGLAKGAYGSANPPLGSVGSPAIAIANTVDPVPESLQLAQELYLENCATCHIALPPAVMPSETWRRLLQERQQHYGVELKLPAAPSVVLMWNYLRTYSRPHASDEKLPYKLNESRYFKALHPKVKLPQSVGLSSCLTCHPGTNEYNFRTLTPEWQDSP